MELTYRIGNGSVRIDFDPNAIQSEKMEEIYDYITTSAKTGKVIWHDDKLTLRSGIVEGVYNQHLTSERMARKSIQNVEAFIRGFEKD